MEPDVSLAASLTNPMEAHTIDEAQRIISRSESALNIPMEPDVSLAASLTSPMEAHTVDEARRIIRPEILETVYSVAEEADGNMRSVVLTAEVKSIDSEKEVKAKTNSDLWSYSYVPKRMMPANDSEEEVASNPESDEGENEPRSNPVVTYNRVMSNHRNVTKPKDVKYKRINTTKLKFRGIAREIKDFGG